MTKNECIKAVRAVYPNSCAVHTIAQTRHYRIWPTSHPFETRVVGRGSTEGAAWRDAYHRIVSGDRV